MDAFSLVGKTALVTGGTRGIGQSMAIGLAEAGADVILVQRNTEEATTKSVIEALGRKCHVIVADLGDRTSVKAIVANWTAAHADIDIDILVNNAGVMRRAEAADYPEEGYDDIMNVNIGGPFFLCRDIGRYWIDRGIKGRLINTASLATFQGGVRMAAYSASKGAVGQLTKALSNEWAGKGIRVNAVAPGYIETDMNVDTRTDPSRQKYFDSITERIPMGRWGRPDEFKGVVVFLASEASAYITGEIITVDGGWMAR